VLLFQRRHIARSLRVIPTGDDQLCVGQSSGHNLERFYHEFKPFVGPPLTERQNPILRIATPRKVRIFGSARQNTMGSDVNIVMPIFFVKNLPIPGHEYRDRVGK
jgi:hypothetical protein